MKSEKQIDLFLSDLKNSEELMKNGLINTNNIFPSIPSTAKDTPSQTFIYGKFNGGDSTGKF